MRRNHRYYCNFEASKVVLGAIVVRNDLIIVVVLRGDHYHHNL